MRRKIDYSLVEKACNGNKSALTEIIAGISDSVYNLSLRMLLFAEDAEDASQEILIKIITHLHSFKGESAFETWVYRVASNYLLTLKSKNTEKFRLSFEQYAQMLDTGHSGTVTYTNNEGELKLLEEEVKISCTNGMLLCLGPMDRVVYILGDIIGLDSTEAAEILEMKADNFRQILARSRRKMRNFMTQKCGLVNTGNSCRCAKKIDFLINQKLIDPKNLQYANKEKSLYLINQIDEIDRSLSVFRGTPNYKFPEDGFSEILTLINTIKTN
jgi:RNA polymerase sigma factor (sigma-70 family)